MLRVMDALKKRDFVKFEGGWWLTAVRSFTL